eukprot:gene6012-5306_t
MFHHSTPGISPARPGDVRATVMSLSRSVASVGITVGGVPIHVDLKGGLGRAVQTVARSPMSGRLIAAATKRSGEDDDSAHSAYTPPSVFQAKLGSASLSSAPQASPNPASASFSSEYLITPIQAPPSNSITTNTSTPKSSLAVPPPRGTTEPLNQTPAKASPTIWTSKFSLAVPHARGTESMNQTPAKASTTIWTSKSSLAVPPTRGTTEPLNQTPARASTSLWPSKPTLAVPLASSTTALNRTPSQASTPIRASKPSLAAPPASGTTALNPTPARASTGIPVHFSLRYATQWGQSIKIIGTGPAL